MNEPAFDAWFRACAGEDGGRAHPYGVAYDGGTCQTSSGVATDVGTHPWCRTPEGVLDLRPFARAEAALRGAPRRGAAQGGGLLGPARRRFFDAAVVAKAAAAREALLRLHVLFDLDKAYRTSEVNERGAFAFAQEGRGGDFWVFTGNDHSIVRPYSPTDDKSAVVAVNTGMLIVCAGS